MLHQATKFIFKNNKEFFLMAIKKLPFSTD